MNGGTCCIQRRCAFNRRLFNAGGRLSLMAGGWLMAVGCTAQPTFSPGSGDEFGTMTDGSGKTYRIVQQSDDTVLVETDGPDGSASIVVDSEGRITSVMRADGSQINLQYPGDGTALVTGNGTFEGETVFYSVVVDLPNSVAKLQVRGQSSGDPFLVCLALDLLCENLEEIIAALLPVILDELIRLQFPSFPTNNEFADSLIRDQASSYVAPLLKEARDFCAGWQLLRLLEISVCDI